jgi:hypothetical protein
LLRLNTEHHKSSKSEKAKAVQASQKYPGVPLDVLHREILSPGRPHQNQWARFEAIARLIVAGQIRIHRTMPKGWNLKHTVGARHCSL